MERNIRDVRDIFGRNAGGEAKQEQELRSYDYSPRSRRRHEAMESYDNRVPTTRHHNNNPSDNRPNPPNKKSNRHRSEDLMEPTTARQSGKKSDDHHQKPSKENSSKNSKDAAYYANRTLTERDIRHLERHLSMKKTIRKQISRNLHQAFVDDPDLVLNDVMSVAKTTSAKVAPDRTFTLTRAKVSKSEQNVLDLLKDNEPDSGHCSADNPNSSDDDTHHEQTRQHQQRSAVGKSPPVDKSSCNNSRPVHDNRNKADVSYNNDGKFSFWKMFSVKNRGKR